MLIACHDCHRQYEVKDLNVGSKADVVVHSAANIVDIFRNLPARRVHIKNGRVVGGIEGSHWCAA